MRLRRPVFGLVVATALLLAVEGGLRLAGSGAWEPLLIERTDVLGRTWGLANDAVGANWFRGAEWEEQIRHPRPMRVPAEKPADTLRIFVVGESAAYGTPWPPHAAWPAMLQATLAAAGARPVEVYNAGIRASALDIQPGIVEELRAWAPDLVVLYAGHNEVYGVRDPPFVADLRLFRLVQTGAPSGEGSRIGLRADFAVPPGDPALADVAARAGADLARVIDAAGPVPVIVVLPVSNERDLAPVGSWVAAGHEEEGRRAAGLVSQVSLAPETAAERRGDLAALEGALPQHAGLQYALGLAALASGDPTEGRRRLDAARELDTVPIRARTDTVAALRRVATERGARVCEPEAALRAASPDGVFDHSVFLDHVHVTLEGGVLLSREVARCIGADPDLAFPVREEALPEGVAVAVALGVTTLDEVAGYGVTEQYFQRATVQASPSRDRSIALLRARREQAAQRLSRVEWQALARGPGGNTHASVAAQLPSGSAMRLAELRRVVASLPDGGPEHALLAAELALTGDTDAAREEATLALLYGVPDAETVRARHGL